MHWIDGHLDLAYLAVNGRDITRALPGNVNGCITLPALRAAEVQIAFGTIFTQLGHDVTERPHGYANSEDFDAAEAAGLLQLRTYYELERAGEISVIRTGDDLDREWPEPKILILMECADPIRAADDLKWWYEQGVRMIGMAWARGSRYAGGNAQPGGLSAAGRELVAAGDEVGIIHDVSHLADDSFDDLLELTNRPIVASHSNCRALLDDNQRHLRDDQIKTIGRRGGIIGLNLFSRFLTSKRHRATLNDCIAHLEHITTMMGTRSRVALGSDMDGGFGPERLPIDLDCPSKLDRLADALREHDWSEEDIAGFAEGNWHRFLKSNLPSSAWQR